MSPLGRRANAQTVRLVTKPTSISPALQLPDPAGVSGRQPADGPNAHARPCAGSPPWPAGRPAGRGSAGATRGVRRVPSRRRRPGDDGGRGGRDVAPSPGGATPARRGRHGSRRLCSCRSGGAVIRRCTRTVRRAGRRAHRRYCADAVARAASSQRRSGTSRNAAACRAVSASGADREAHGQRSDARDPIAPLDAFGARNLFAGCTAMAAAAACRWQAPEILGRGVRRAPDRRSTRRMVRSLPARDAHFRARCHRSETGRRVWTRFIHECGFRL